MVEEPHINAIDVKSMAAFGENPELLSLLDLAKADGALNQVIRWGSEGDGERSEEIGIEAMWDEGGRMEGIGRGEEGNPATASSAEKVHADVEME